MMNLVDLAGSERLKKSESQGIRLKEALHINTSLSALGKVIMSLDPSAESTHIPYRDAKLTRILQNSLGGNAYTVVLAAIHPHASHYDECLSTLQFANRCRYVRNNPRVNYTDGPADKDQRLRRQLDELVSLRARVAQYERNGAIAVAKETGSASMSLTKLADVLRKLGIAVDIAPGGVLLVNGERRELMDLGLSEAEKLFTDDVIDLTEGSDSSTGKEVSKDKLKKLCVDLQEANRLHIIKFKDRNILLQEQSKQIEDLSKQINRLQVVIKRGANDLSVQRESFEVRATEEKKLANDMQRLEIDKLTQHNDIFVKKRMALLQDAPNTFKSYTQMMKLKTAEKADYEEPLRREFQVQMAAAAALQEAELTGLKKQYDYFLKEKDKMLSDFAEKFTEYRSKKMEQLRLCEQEIIRLFVYSEAVDSILNNVEKGAYRVELTSGSSPPTLISGMRTAAGSVSTYGRSFGSNHEDNQLETRCPSWEIVFPKGLRPLNLFLQGGNNEMKLAKKIVERHLQRKEKLGQTQGPSGNEHTTLGRNVSSVNSTQNDSVELDPQVEQRLRDLLTPALVKGNLFRPKSSKRGTAKTLQRTSSSPGLPKSLAIIASREKSGVQDGSSAAGSPYKGDGRGRLHTAPDCRQLSFFNKDQGQGLNQTIGPASSLFSRTEGFTATWAAESKHSSSDCSTASKVPGIEGPGSKRTAIVNGEESELLKSRISELKSEMMIDQVYTTIYAYF
jgi:Kinesin motor domain